MGWTPADVKRSTAYEFLSAWSGFVDFHSGENGQPEPMTKAELDALLTRTGKWQANSTA